MAVIDSAVLLLRGHTYSGTGDWLDESGNNYDGVVTGATFSTDHFIFDAADEVITVADTADLDFDEPDSFTLMVVFEVQTTTPASFEWVVGNSQSLQAIQKGYVIERSTTSTIAGNVADGTDYATDYAPGTLSADTKHVMALRRNATANEVECFLDGTGSGTPATDDLTTDSYNAYGLTIGERGDGTNTERFNGWIYAVALWRSALSDADIATAGTELQETITPGVDIDFSTGVATITGGNI